MRDLERLHQFLLPKSSTAAHRAAATIIKTVQMLEEHPQIGRPVEDMDPEYRELLIDFGDSGYIALYRLNRGIVTVLALRHQKEAGYL